MVRAGLARVVDRVVDRLASVPRLFSLALVIADLFAVLGAGLIAGMIHYETGSPGEALGRLSGHYRSVLPLLVVYVGVFAWLRLYRRAWRFASIETLGAVLLGTAIGAVTMIVLQHLLDGGRTVSLSLVLVYWLLTVFFVGGIRIVLRMANISRLRGRPSLADLRQDIPPKRAVVLGVAEDCAELVRSLGHGPGSQYEIVGILDDSPATHGLDVVGVRVLGPINKLGWLIEHRGIEEVLVATVGASVREQVVACRARGIPVKVVPPVREVLDGRAQFRLAQISVEDLLRRPLIRSNIKEIGSYITGKRVMVTGAGGSIGSELCRQICALNPLELVLLGHGENSVESLSRELSQAYPALCKRLHIAIGSVVDERRLEALLREFGPQVVFHAAAHKHVPIMEYNASEAVRNNIFGTRCVAEACGRHGVGRMILISTDKAVYPLSVMGATKWFAEEVVQLAAAEHPRTTYVTVRFGNVLGSRGSVTVLFSEQIARGGPVTVTHAEATRYFMTISEAVQLVLQAGAIGESGDLYILDMGDPVRIVDLARDMITLAGFRPDVDIPITYTGLRLGERLHESLKMDHEEIGRTDREGLLRVVRNGRSTREDMKELLRRLWELGERGESGPLVELLMASVPHARGSAEPLGSSGYRPRKRWFRPSIQRSGGGYGCRMGISGTEFGVSSLVSSTHDGGAEHHA